MDMSLDTTSAAEFLRRMAPTQSHLGRKQFRNAANLLTSVNVELKDTYLGPVGMAVVCIPVYNGKEFLGWAEMTISRPASDDEKPEVSAEFRSYEPEEATR